MNDFLKKLNRNKLFYLKKGNNHLFWNKLIFYVSILVDNDGSQYNLFI